MLLSFAHVSVVATFLMFAAFDSTSPDRFLYLPQTSGATDFEYFEINGDSYLAVAHSVGPIRNGKFDFETTSVIYKANRAAKEFQVFQEIPTYG